MQPVDNWYIIKTEKEQCKIVALAENQSPEKETYWGPFLSKEEAIARRVGLIRAGKCQPQ